LKVARISTPVHFPKTTETGSHYYTESTWHLADENLQVLGLEKRRGPQGLGNWDDYENVNSVIGKEKI
jgi:hypothetical protein